MPKYNTNIFYIDPKKSRIVMQQDSGLIPTKHTNYYVYNVGKTNVRVTVKSGNALLWTRTLETANLSPGEQTLLDISKHKCLITGVHIINDDNTNGFVHCSQITGYPFYDNNEHSVPMDIELVSKILVTFGVANFPRGGFDLCKTIDIFWPEDKESVWVKILSVVLYLLDKNTQDMVKNIIDNELTHFKNKIKAILQDLEKDFSNKTALQKYTDIADDLVGLENKFVLEEKHNPDYIKINYILLPFYSSVVNLKLKYYQFGIVNQKLSFLPDAIVDRLRGYVSKLVTDLDTGAIAYVNKVRQDQLNQEYKHVYAEIIYDALVTVRAYTSLTGLEFIPFWASIAEDPESVVEPYNDIITFSPYFGRPTPMLHRQMVKDDHDAPLAPTMVQGKRLLPEMVDVFYLIDALNEPKIAGMTVWYEDGSNANTGNVTSTFARVNFNCAHLLKLAVWGWGQIDGLEFIFCDGRSVKVGTTVGQKHIFELLNHHIVGFFLANDFPQLEGQAANICLAYKLCQYESEHSAKDKCFLVG